MLNELVLKTSVYVECKFRDAKEGLKKMILPQNGIEDRGEMMIDKVGGMAIIVVILGVLFIGAKYIIGNAEAGTGALGSVNEKIQDFFD